MQVSRRVFLRYAGALGGLAALNKSGLMTLKNLSPSEAEAMQTSMGKYEVKYTADAMCPAECGMEMWIKDGKIAKIYGNKAVPMNDGIACAKGASAQQLVYSPYRLKYPMIRVGERGEGKFKRITWDEAIDYLGRKLTDIKKNTGLNQPSWTAAMLQTGTIITGSSLLMELQTVQSTALSAIHQEGTVPNSWSAARDGNLIS